MRPSPYIIEQSGLFASRARHLEPVFSALRPAVEHFLASAAMLNAARRRFASTQGRLEGVDGGFEVSGVFEQMMAQHSRRAPQNIPHHVRRCEVPQHEVHPLRQYYEFPAKMYTTRVHVLRQMTTEERKKALFFVLSDFALEKKLIRVFKKHAGRWIFMVPSAHGEAASPLVI